MPLQLLIAVLIAVTGYASALGMGATFGISLIPSQLTYAADCTTALELTNGSFEYPVWSDTGVGMFPAGDAGWDTTDSAGQIEIWGVNNPLSLAAYDGSQFAEINANSLGELSQTLDTTDYQGQSLSWSFAHHARDGAESMQLLIGAPGAEVSQGSFTTSTEQGWVVYSGTYTVPEGQTQTRFAYSSLTGSGTGNFIDGVSFGMACTPAVSVTLTTDVADNSPLTVGQVITYTIDVTNTGTIDLDNVKVTDLPDGFQDLDPATIATLAKGDTATFTATYTVTQEDVDAGVINTSITAGADTPGNYNGAAPSATGTHTQNIAKQGALALDVTSNIPDGGSVKAGDVITYTYTATNTGNGDVEGVTISDTLPGMVCDTDTNVGTLAPGASATVTCSYTVTQDDIDNGGVTNQGTVTGTPTGSSEPISATGSAGSIAADPGVIGLTLDTTTEPTGTVVAGDVITYTFTLTNVGTVPVDGITVTDPSGNLGEISGPHGATLQPGESATFTATYTVTDADVAAGVVAITPQASATGPSGETITADGGSQLAACPTAATEDDADIAGAAATPIVVEPSPTAELVECAPLPTPTTVPSTIVPTTVAPTQVPAEPTQIPAEPTKAPGTNPGNPSPTKVPATNGGGTNGGATGGGSATTGGTTAPAVSALPNTGQGSQASSFGATALIGTLAGMLMILAVGVLAVQRRRSVR